VGFGQVVASGPLGFRPPPPVLVPPAVAAAGTESGPDRPTRWDLGSFARGASVGPWTVEVDWGDGTSVTTRADVAGPIVLPHAYVDQGQYTATIRVRSAEGGTAQAGVPIAITNAAPTAAFAAGPAVPVGQASTVGFANAADPSPADVAAGLRYSFDFNNDGDFADPGDMADAASATASHTFPAVGTYLVRGRVADRDGGFTDHTATVAVTQPPEA
jgi:PKD repeat protein